MLYQEAGDRIDIAVRADDIDCPELHVSRQWKQNQCWIAVKAGQAISVIVDLELDASQFQADLVVDGILRNIQLSTACPTNTGRKHIFEFYEGVHKFARSMFRSDMKTSRLADDIEYNESDRTSVGTIEVFVYKYEQGYNHLRTAELPENVVYWEDLKYKPGTAGIQPTHEVVLNGGLRLNDTERRTWSNKSSRPVFGLTPVVTFKYLYRHERLLREANIINPYRDFLPSVDSVRAMASGLQHIAMSGTPIARNATGNTSTSATRIVGPSQGPMRPMAGNASNPYAITERNGIRTYELVTLVPDVPGPQTNPAYLRSGKSSGKKRKKRATTSGLTGSGEDTGSDAEYMPTHAQTSASDSHNNKRKKRHTTQAEEVEYLRAKVAELQAEVDKAKHHDIMETEIDNAKRHESSEVEVDGAKHHEYVEERETDSVEIGQYVRVTNDCSDASQPGMNADVARTSLDKNLSRLNIEAKQTDVKANGAQVQNNKKRQTGPEERGKEPGEQRKEPGEHRKEPGEHRKEPTEHRKEPTERAKEPEEHGKEPAPNTGYSFPSLPYYQHWETDPILEGDTDEENNNPLYRMRRQYMKAFKVHRDKEWAELRKKQQLREKKEAQSPKKRNTIVIDDDSAESDASVKTKGTKATASGKKMDISNIVEP